MRLFLWVLLSIIPLFSILAQKDNVISTLEVFDLETNERTTIRQEDRHFEAPNWSRDGDYLLINQAGNLYKVFLDGSKEKFDTDFADRCNNDHGISFDGKTLAFSHNLEPDPDGWLTSCIFTMPMKGGKPKRVTDKIPSFWHGWSPDGNTLLYTAKRGDYFNIYSIPVEGGEETMLTDSDVLDDGPTYSMDGKRIYYNSMQSGTMEIWRMDADGENKEQLTNDDYSNWFAHPSPDGKHLVFISYLQDQGSGHPAMKEVVIRLYTIQNHEVSILCGFTGGQGSLNVPSWSPDGKKFAFVSYRYK